jgi:tetratricopeptide (TPR) repeat protein
MDYTEIFDRYIDGRLEGKELEDFNKKLKTDNEFRKALEKYIRLNDITAEAVRERKYPDQEFQVDESTDELSLQDIAKYGKDRRDAPDEKALAFSETLSRAEKDSLNRSSRSITGRLSVQLAFAATVVIVILIALFLLLRQNTLTTDDLFAMFYKPYVETEDVLEITRASDNFYYALKVFGSGDYARAAILFDELADTAELKVYASFYSGLTFMEMGRWEEAVKKLEKAIGYGKTPIENSARWYLGLCFLRIDDSKSARRQFEILASHKNEYTARSRRILRLMH